MTSNNNSRVNTDEEMCSEEEEENQCELEPMLNDHRWSVSKGTKGESKTGPNQLTPLKLPLNSQRTTD